MPEVTPQVPEQQRLLNEMRAETMGPLTEGDQKAHDALQDEITQARAEHFKDLGASPVTRLVEVSGAAVPQEVVAQARAEGQDVSVHASAGRQS